MGFARPGDGVGDVEHRIVGSGGNLEIGTIHRRGVGIRQVGKIPGNLLRVYRRCYAVVREEVRRVQKSSAKLIYQRWRENVVNPQCSRVRLEPIASSGLGEVRSRQIGKISPGTRLL